jgi:hypothetical protein
MMLDVLTHGSGAGRQAQRCDPAGDRRGAAQNAAQADLGGKASTSKIGTAIASVLQLLTE